MTFRPAIADPIGPALASTLLRKLVLHRLTALLLVWLTLLGAAAPALACIMVDRDCCDHAGTMPCGDSKAPVNETQSVSCAAVPLASPAVCAESLRERPWQAAFGSPEPIMAGSSLSLSTRALHRAPAPALTHSPPYPDAAQTYLRTGRLRL